MLELMMSLSREKMLMSAPHLMLVVSVQNAGLPEILSLHPT
jgi:hypothetical protein